MKPLSVLGAFALACVFFLSGCGGAAVRNRAAYDHYADIVVKRSQDDARARQDAIQALAGASAACGGDARCVEHVTAVTALAYVGAGGSGGAPLALAPPPREPSAGEKFAAFAGAVSPLLGTLANGAVQWHQADTSRDVSRAQYAFLGGVVHDTASAAAAMQPSVSVGGDYVAGDGNTTVRGHVGDSIGGSVVGGDQIGRDRTDNSGVIHTGDGDRYGSDGPYTGPICSGSSCQPTDSGNTGGDAQPSGG